MIRALALAIGDLPTPKILGVIGRSLVVTLIIFAIAGLCGAWALSGSDPCSLFGDESCPLGASASGFGAFLLTALAIWFLFPAIALGVVSAYMDRIVTAVEERHYPAAFGTARPMGLGGGALLGLRSALRVILYNLVALPFYILLLVTGVGPLILFVIVNGAAFGRDLGEMVSARHADRATRNAWLRATRGDRLLIGAICAGLFLIPIVNLIAPVLGAAAAAHLFHQRRR